MKHGKGKSRNEEAGKQEGQTWDRGAGGGRKETQQC